MKTYNTLWNQLCSWDNLESAYWKARRRKSSNPKVRDFDEHWQYHIAVLLNELRTKRYKPSSLSTFVLRDPKTRVISVAEFRDRVVHHALINILQPIFESRFIEDSFANRKGKGTLKALNRFDSFKRKLLVDAMRGGGGHRPKCYVLKADIKQYFQTVNHQVLLDIIARRVKDKDVLWLVKTTLGNYNSGQGGVGMPLGNWTSQFFANVYLNELDQFVKHKLKVQYYIRYVDDFVILHNSRRSLQYYERKIKDFLPCLKLSLHPNKCKILRLDKGVGFLGFRVFPSHRIPRKRNIRKAEQRLRSLLSAYALGDADAWFILDSWHGWNGYAMHGNTYRLRRRMQKNLIRGLEGIAKLKSGL